MNQHIESLFFFITVHETDALSFIYNPLLIDM